MRRNPSRSRAILRNPEGIRIYRGSATIPGEGTYKSKLIGSGMFAKAYYLEGRKVPILAAIKDASGDNSKELLALASHDSGNNPYIPRVRKLGWNNTEVFYEMPLYRAPLRKSNSPKAWSQYVALRKCWLPELEKAQRKASQRGIHPMNFGHEIIDGTLDCARRSKAVPPKLVSALAHIGGWAKTYGAEYSFEFSPRNLATTPRGRLILLDPVFSMRAVRMVQQAQRKRW